MTAKIIQDVENEIGYSRTKFPAFHSGHEAYAVIKEEFEELWEDIKCNNTDSKKYQEAIQCIAMLTCYIEEVLKID